MTPEIRRIAHTESDLVVELFDKYRVFYKQPSDIELTKNFIQAQLVNNESVIFIASVNDANKTVPVGFVQLYPKSPQEGPLKYGSLTTYMWSHNIENKESVKAPSRLR